MMKKFLVTSQLQAIGLAEGFQKCRGSGICLAAGHWRGAQFQFNFAPISVIAGFIPATHGSALLASEYMEEWVPAINAGMTSIGKIWLDPAFAGVTEWGGE